MTDHLGQSERSDWEAEWFSVSPYEDAGLVGVHTGIGPVDAKIRMYPDEARALAARLVEAAEQVEGAARG